MLTVDITTRAPFENLFPVREAVLDEIVKDIRKNGFDNSKPIVLWRKRGLTVVDGHTRLEAAKRARLKNIPTVMKEFPDEDAALEYAIKCQRNRRNLSDQEILQCVSELDKRRTKAEAGAMKGKKLATGVARSSEKTADVLGIGRGKVEKARVVLDKAPDEIREAVKSGEMSINQAYNQTVNPLQGSPESLDKATKEIGNVEKVFDIVRKHLSREQIKELIGLLQQAV